jgi:hypothetical protein
MKLLYNTLMLASMATTGLALTVEEEIVASQSHCSKSVMSVVRNCSACSASGIYYTRNNDFLVRAASPSEIINVSDDELLAVQMCNVNNMNVRDYHVDLGMTLVTTLVGSVGARAQVKVEVINSTNIEVGADSEFELGMKIAEGELTQDFPDASLISEIVKGEISEFGEVPVKIPGRNTGAWIGKGTLIQEIINYELIGGGNINNAFLEVDVSDSANVEQAARTAGAKLYIRDGQLDDETLDLPSYPGRTRRLNSMVKKMNVANVRGIESLLIWDGELSDETVDVGDLVDSQVNLNLQNVGNAAVTGWRAGG